MNDLNIDKVSQLVKLLGLDDNYIDLYDLKVNEEPEEEVDEENIDKTEDLYFEKRRKKIKPITDLKVRPVIAEEDDYIFINDNLPKIPFSMIMASHRGGGKTTATHFLIDQINNYFDEIIIFSPTIELDIKYKELFKKLNRDFEVGKNIFYKYDEGILKKILAKIKKKNKNKKFVDKIKVLMVYDDIICGLPKQQRKTIFNKLLLNNRHYAVSVIINSQSFKLFDTSLRKNCSQVCIWRTDNLKELQNYIDEFSGNLGVSTKERKENFYKLYCYATNDKHSFLYINSHNREQMFYKGFDEPIDIKSVITKPLQYYLPDLIKCNTKLV